MDTRSVPAPPATRELRGLALYRERGEEITRVYPHGYLVPSCSGEETYLVRLDRETCECPDHARHPERTCKHLSAATIKAAKGRRRDA